MTANPSMRMRRPLAAVLAGCLVVVASAGQDARADSFTPRQDPPTISIESVSEVDTDGSDFGASPVTLSTENFSSFQPGVEDDTDAAAELADRTLYAVEVQVETNGELDSITLVALCLFQSGSAPAADADVSATCGYGEDGSTDAPAGGNLGTAPSSPDPRTVLSMRVTGGDTDASGTLDAGDTNSNGAYVFAIDGTNTHGLESVTDATFVVDDTDTPENKLRTFTFVFDLSHAANKGADWYLRAVAVTQPPKLGGEENAPTAQWVQAIDTTARSVLYFGGITSNRPSVDYGPLAVETPVEETDIVTGDYYANNTSNITLSATPFTHTSGGVTDSIALSDDGDTVSTAGSAELSLACDSTTDDGASPIQVTGTVTTLLGSVAKSSDDAAGKEAATTADTHDCTITYGGGAKFGSQAYTNTVTVGIYDTADSGFNGTSEDLGSTAINTP